MLRKVLGMVLLLGALSGCTEPLRVCESDADCEGGGVCDLTRNLCYSTRGGEQETDGGVCERDCASYEACTVSGRCVPRYTALVMTPGDGGLVGSGTIPVRAELLVGTGVGANFPETLKFTVVQSDGGPGGTLTPATRSEGRYTAQWTPPGEGMFLLTAAHPEAGGPSTTAHLTVDRTPPTFAVRVPPSDAGPPDGGTTYADPELANAWRRDQVVPVEIRTNEPNLDPASVTVALQGTDGGVAPAIGVAPFSGPCDAGFCGVAQLKLWEPVFDAFRGSLPIVVQGRDRAGNVGNASSFSVNVTRWKWVFDASSGGTFAIKAPPAVGMQGSIYFGTSASSNGKVYALHPDGSKQWEVQLGAVEGSPAVGAYDAGTEFVYVGAKNSSGVSLYALRGDDGGTRLKCPSPDATVTYGAGSLAGAIAVGLTSAEPIETAISVYNSTGSSMIVGIKPEANVGQQCPSIVSPGSPGEKIPAISQGSSLVMRDENIFYPGAGLTPKVTSYVFGSNTPRSGWPINLSIVPRNLALVGANVIGAGGSIEPPVNGGVFSAPQDGALEVARLYPQASWSSRVFSLAVGSGNTIFFGAELDTGEVQFNRLGMGTSALLTVPSASPIRVTPVIGRGGWVYTVTMEGSVGAWSADDLSPRWTLSTALGAVEASPTLDCSRSATGSSVEGNHGVLYVPAGGRLYAFVVDSRGLDTSAPWPKYQHDARNTGNPATPITSCQ